MGRQERVSLPDRPVLIIYGRRLGDCLGVISMLMNSRRIHLYLGGMAAVCICWSAIPASAAIIGTDAAVATTVQELIDGVPGSVTSDTEELALDLSNFPLTASGSLVSTDLEGALVSMGQAFCEFSDPTRLDQPNPEEFAMEVACFSNAESVAYSVTSATEELRTVVFTTPGNPLADPEIDFGSGSTRTVESRVFLSGAVIFWSTEPGRNLDEMLSELSVAVTEADTNATLFETTLTIAGEGTDQVRSAATGPIRFEVVDLDALVNEGVGEDTISVLQRVEREGTLVVVAIPPQEHPYTYTVTADEPLILGAELTAEVHNIPGGTGVAATLGRPFENLGDFIEQGLPGVDGATLQRSLNAVTASRAIGLVTPEGAQVTGTGMRLCGAFGFESAALLALGLIATLGRSRR